MKTRLSIKSATQTVPLAVIIMLLVAAASFILSGCNRGEKDPVAGLNELPHEAATKLKVVPNSTLLATKIQQISPAPPSQAAPPPPCPKDASITYYDAQITTPITLCSQAKARVSFKNVLFQTGSATTTYKFTDTSVFESAEVKQAFPFVCTVRNGPWSARMTAQRLCVGTCSPQNDLTVVGVPNNVEFSWVGAFTNHPSGFEFIGTPTQTDQIDLGSCHAATQIYSTTLSTEGLT